MATQLAFNDSSLITRFRGNSSNYHHFFPSKEQFTIIEPFISGSEMAGGFTVATEFLATRDSRLNEEAIANDGDLPLGCCSSYVDPDLLCVYQTTSGTVLCVDVYGHHQISLPISRSGGFHHKIILLTLAGVTEFQLGRYENLHNVNKDEYQAAHKERKDLYDPILAPYGYKPCESWEQHVQALSDRKARLISQGEWSIDDDTDYEEYEDYDS